MDMKSKLKNEVLLSLKNHLTPQQMTMVEDALIRNMIDLEINSIETLPALLDDTNEQLIKLFIMKRGDKLSEKTLTYYLNTIKQFLTIIGNKSLLTIVPADVEYFLQVKKQRNNPISLNNLRRNLSAFFTWMRKSHIITENPCESIEPYKEPTKPIDHLTVEEMVVLKQGCKTTRDNVIIEVLRSTACRIGEILPIKVKDINFSTGKILIYGEKTSEYRPVWLDSVALMFVKQYIKARGIEESSDEPLFVSKDKRKSLLKASGIRCAIKRIVKRSGLNRRVYPHLFRKTTATKIISRGASMSEVGEYLGHKDKSTAAQHYACINEEHTKRIFDMYVATV